MRRASLLNALTIAALLLLLLLLSVQASAQPVLAPFTGTARVFVWADDNGPVDTTELDMLTSSLFASDAGHLSSPPGTNSTTFFQNASGTASSDTSVVGPLAPFIAVGADASGTQAGIIASNFPVASQGAGGQIWEFAFYAPTFSAQVFDVPIAFTADALLDTSGSSTGLGFNGSGISNYHLDGFVLLGPVSFSAQAGSAFLPSVVVSEDFVTGEGFVWLIRTSASANAGGAENVVGQTGTAIASASIGAVTVTIDYALTLQLIQNTTPLSPADTLQGLTELTLVASTGVSVPAFLLPEPSSTWLLASGVPLLAALAQRRRRAERDRRHRLA